MKQNPLLLPRFAFPIILLIALTYNSPAGAAPFVAHVPNPSGQPAVIHASTNLLNWQPIFTNTTGDTVITFTDSANVGLASRFYRAVPSSSGTSTNQTLPDLAQSPNTVFQAGEGFNTVQFAPDGRLGFIVWKGQQLILRERSPGGDWSEQVIIGGGATFQTRNQEEYRFQAHAALIYDSASVPHVLRVAAGTVWHHVRGSGGTWSSTEQISTAPAGSSISLFAACGGPNNSLHMAFVSADFHLVTHASNQTGTWQWSTVATVSGNPRGFLQQSWAPRFFALAVDGSNHAHLVYTPEFKMTAPDGYFRPDSALAYASNESGSWQTRVLSTAADGSGDAGTGASIAIAPDGRPAVAAWYNERAPTGSSQWSQLRYFKLDASGTWTNQTLTGSPDNYIAADGERGTGFAPYLRFDSLGRAHILFSDHASQHFPNTGQNEYAGQIRHALLTGSQWSLRTLMPQADPLQGQMIYPAFAIRNNELFVTTLERSTVWGPDSWPRTVESTYRLQARSFSF
jgi:hypothetical protein